MNRGTKVLTLAAAALAAAMAAPKADARPEVSWGVAVGPVYVGGYHYARHNPYRVIAGYRYYRYCPGPGWAHVSYGWGWRPHPRAVWVAPHRGPYGYWVRGSWR
ncbi:MAG: hypothetical protein ACM3JH_00230 [Acidithiobacillales bacterium]